MRVTTYWIAVACAGLLALPAAGQAPDAGGPPADPNMRQKILDAFDTNHDGNLDQPERQAIRRAMQEFFSPGGREGRGPEGRRGPEDRRPGAQRGPAGERRPDVDRGPDARRGPADRDRPGRGPEGRRGPMRPDGPPPPPRPERLFNRFDQDRDNELNREEFMRLTRFVRRMRLGPPPGPPSGPRFDRGRPDGPPPPRGEFRGRGPRDDRPPRADNPPPPADEPALAETPPDEVL